MNRLPTKLAVLLAASALAAGCAFGPEEDPVMVKLEELDQRVEAIERVIRNESLLQIATEIDILRDEVRELRGQAEALQYEADSAATRQRDQYLDLDQRLQSLERRTRGAGLPADPGAQLPTAPAPVPGTQAPRAGDDRSGYDAALEMLRQGRYPQAEAGFRQFLADFPNSDLAANAQYWLAETHYVNRDFEAALAEFRKVVDAHPNSRKVPDALLKIGFTNYELQRWSEARTALQSVVDNHPDTTAARFATQRLERMRSERR